MQNPDFLKKKNTNAYLRLEIRVVWGVILSVNKKNL